MKNKRLLSVFTALCMLTSTAFNASADYLFLTGSEESESSASTFSTDSEPSKKSFNMASTVGYISLGTLSGSEPITLDGSLSLTDEEFTSGSKTLGIKENPLTGPMEPDDKMIFDIGTAGRIDQIISGSGAVTLVVKGIKDSRSSGVKEYEYDFIYVSPANDDDDYLELPVYAGDAPEGGFLPEQFLEIDELSVKCTVRANDVKVTTPEEYNKWGDSILYKEYSVPAFSVGKDFSGDDTGYKAPVLNAISSLVGAGIGTKAPYKTKHIEYSYPYITVTGSGSEAILGGDRPADEPNRFLGLASQVDDFFTARDDGLMEFGFLPHNSGKGKFTLIFNYGYADEIRISTDIDYSSGSVVFDMDDFKQQRIKSEIFIDSDVYYTMTTDDNSVNRIEVTEVNFSAIGSPDPTPGFPDPIFRAYVEENADINNDGMITRDELVSITSIDVRDMGITDLKGIEYFTGLTELFCGGNQLTTLDISQNKALTGLYCDNNQLTTLNVSRNKALTSLSCDNNQLTTLDVSQNTALETLYCEGNQLTALDLSNNNSLSYLRTEPDITIQAAKGSYAESYANENNIPFVPTDKTPAISGKITISGGAGDVSGTMLSIKNSDGTIFETTILFIDDTFSVTDTLPDGDYTLTASKSKCCPRDYPVTIKNGQMSGKLNIELQLYGDIDNNGIVTLDDVIDVINYFNKKTSAISSADKDLQEYLCKVSDVDKDGVVKLDDAIEMINYFNKKASAFDKIA